MSKSTAGVAVTFFLTVAATIAPGISDHYRLPAFIATVVLLALSCLWWFFAHKSEGKSVPAFTASAGRDLSGTVAGRDVHQNIYQGADTSQSIPLIKFQITADHTCYSTNTWAIGPVRFLHAKIVIDHGSVLCSAYLTRIAKGTEVKWEHGPEQLTFSNHTPGDPLPRMLYHGLSYNLDVLVIVASGNEIRVCNDERQWRRWPRLHEIFAEKGDYILTITLAGDGAQTKTVELQLNWTGNWQTSFLTLLNEQSPPLTERGSLKVSYDENSLDCMWPVTFQSKDGQATWKGIMARLRVDSETESNIKAVVLTSLERNSKTVASGVQLPFLFTPAQSPGSDTKTIKPGQTEYLEVLWIPESGEPEIKTTNFPYAFAEYQKLDRQYSYSLHVAFSVDNSIIPIIINAEYRNDTWRLSIIRAAVGSA